MLRYFEIFAPNPPLVGWGGVGGVGVKKSLIICLITFLGSS